MKTTHILSLVILFVIVGCGEKPNELAKKKETLKTLKQQVGELKTQITLLEKEIDLADTLSEGGIAVKVLELQSRLFEHYINQPGIVSSRANVLVSSEVATATERLLVKEGSWVAQHQAIVQLNAEVMINQVEDLNQSVELAQTTYERQDNLWQQGIGSEMQYLQAKNQYLSLNKKLAAMQAQLDKYELSAPISGRVDEIFVNVGEFVSMGQPIFRVVNSKKLQIEVDVAERYSAIIKKGDMVKIEFSTLGIELEEKIVFVGQVINPENRTFKVKININNQSDVIKPNAVASLKIKDFSADSALVLPSEAIKKDMRGSFVFIAKDNKAVKKYIETGLSEGFETHITSGLEVGQKVITVGFDEVANGSKIEIK